jgi:hypothetical protein
VIARADQANVKTEELKRLVSKELHSERMKIQICDTRQGLDLQLASTSKEWSEAAYTALDAGLISEEAWKQRRNHGVYKFGANVQKFANNLAKVVDAYSGIVDVVVKAGGPYGSAGYTALSCLLAVSTIK